MNNYVYKIKSKLGMITPRQRAEYLKSKGILNVGEGCEIYGNVGFGSEPYLVKLGDKVRITKGVQFLTHDGGLWVLRIDETKQMSREEKKKYYIKKFNLK